MRDATRRGKLARARPASSTVLSIGRTFAPEALSRFVESVKRKENESARGCGVRPLNPSADSGFIHYGGTLAGLRGARVFRAGNTERSFVLLRGANFPDNGPN